LSADQIRGLSTLPEDLFDPTRGLTEDQFKSLTPETIRRLFPDQQDFLPLDRMTLDQMDGLAESMGLPTLKDLAPVQGPPVIEPGGTSLVIPAPSVVPKSDRGKADPPPASPTLGLAPLRLPAPNFEVAGFVARPAAES